MTTGFGDHSSAADRIEVRDGLATILVGDVMARLADLADESVDCVVTSPPYWGLRDYEVDGQIGIEPTLGEHIDRIVAVCAEIWRVLKPTGTFWLNYGDCYATTPNGRSASAIKAAGTDDRSFRDKPFSTVGPIRRSGATANLGNTAGDAIRRNAGGPIYVRDWATPRGAFHAADLGLGTVGTRRLDHGGRVVAGGYLKPKDLCMVPNRIAIALQEWGWWVRSEIIWGKPNPMPDSSGSQRPSTAHEKVFLLAKSADAPVWRARDTGELSFNPDLAERCPLVTDKKRTGVRWLRVGTYYDANAVLQGASPNTHARLAQDLDNQRGSHRANGGQRANGAMKAVPGKTLPDRSAGVKNNASFRAAIETEEREAALARKRGLTPRHQGGINHAGLDRPGRGRYLRNYEPAALTVWEVATQPFRDAHFATFPIDLAARAIAAGCPAGGVVLDPFGGAGTTAVAALRLGRRAVLIELNPKYARLAARRLQRDFMGPDERRRDMARDRAVPPDQAGPLFTTRELAK